MGGGTGGAFLVYVGMNDAEKEGTSAIVGTYRRLVKTLRGTDWTDWVVWDITSNGKQVSGEWRLTHKYRNYVCRRE